MEWTLPEATQRPWRHRPRSSGQHTTAHYQVKLRWDSNHGWDGYSSRRPERWHSTWRRWNSFWNMEEQRRQSVQQMASTNHQCWEVGSVPQAWKDGCPEKFTTMIEALYTGIVANVSVEGEDSESFSVTNGVKQGCMLAPTLFSIFLSAMLDDAFRDEGDGVYIQSRQSADPFNVAHFRANTKTTRILMRELLFADDNALVAHSAEEMQKIVDAFSDASKKFGLKINIKKTEVLYQPNYTRTREEDIMVDGNKLNSVLEFTYFASTI